jgi:hypothetical protein
MECCGGLLPWNFKGRDSVRLLKGAPRRQPHPDYATFEPRGPLAENCPFDR